jgi:type IX secretion system PorP/SprF family membrane protein
MAKIITGIKFTFLLLFVSFFALAQQSPILSLSIPYQNSLLYNRYLINPTFSFVGEKNTNISLFSRTQWVGFNDAPKVYQLNYSGRFSEDTGYGIGLYHQNLGVITSFGGIGNAAYYVPFQEDMGLTLGANLVFYSVG